MNLELKKFLKTFFAYNKDSPHNERLLNRPFKWQGVKEDLDLINSLDPTLVLDLGCGDNRYKGLVNNLIGIDIADKPLVDIVSNFTNLEFENNSVDAIIAYGSINFGEEELIAEQLQEAKRVLKDKGIICFRGYSSTDPFYYYWTEERCNYFTEKFNFKLIKDPKIIYRLDSKGNIKTDWRDRRSEKLHNKGTRDITRLHWIWQK